MHLEMHFSGTGLVYHSITRVKGCWMIPPQCICVVIELDAAQDQTLPQSITSAACSGYTGIQPVHIWFKVASLAHDTARSQQRENTQAVEHQWHERIVWFWFLLSRLTSTWPPVLTLHPDPAGRLFAQTYTEEEVLSRLQTPGEVAGPNTLTFTAFVYSHRKSMFTVL
uniref:Uncharacterized protein n=1 Tax=Knipowitschia caucasica TaxID=637954 RepID=A0AAV2JE12_KNICA